MRLFFEFAFVISTAFFAVGTTRRILSAEKNILDLQRGISDYNYIVGSKGMPMIGQTPDGKLSPGARGIWSEDYLKERE